MDKLSLTLILESYISLAYFVTHTLFDFLFTENNFDLLSNVSGSEARQPSQLLFPKLLSSSVSLTTFGGAIIFCCATMEKYFAMSNKTEQSTHARSL